MGHGINSADNLLQAVIGQDRHKRTEDFFLHDPVRKGYIVKDRRFNLECFPVSLSALYNFLLIDQPKNTVKMFFIDDLSIIGILKGLFSILLLDL